MNDFSLLPAQLAALMACADGGSLRRTPSGYCGTDATVFHTTRTVNFCVRQRLLAFVEGQGETRLEPTQHGWEIARQIAQQRAAGFAPGARKTAARAAA